MKFLNKIKKIFNLHYRINDLSKQIELLKFQNGEIINELSKLNKSNNISDHEFKVYSQWGEDGIINYFIKNLNIKNKFFIEFGVEDYTEANTRFLLKKFNWEGLVIDSSEKNIERIKSDQIYWQYSLNAKCDFVTKENINIIFSKNNIPFDIGLLSIDIDGNDYWIWKEINTVNPSIVIIEYNSLLGFEKNYVVPYDKKFERNKAHYSNIYYGASLPALVKLGNEKGYALIGCNSAGNNAFFVKKNLLNDKVRELTIEKAFQNRKFRESRNKNNKLTFLNSNESKKLISHLDLEEV